LSSRTGACRSRSVGLVAASLICIAGCGGYDDGDVGGYSKEGSLVEDDLAPATICIVAGRCLSASAVTGARGARVRGINHSSLDSACEHQATHPDDLGEYMPACLNLA
jgi:hypothetical protein